VSLSVDPEDREDMGETVEEMKKARSSLRSRIAQVVSWDLPMVIMRPYLVSLREELQRELEVEFQRFLADVAAEKHRLFSETLKELATTLDHEVAATIDKAWDRTFPKRPSNQNVRHTGLSPEQKRSLCSQLEQAQQAAVRNIDDLLDDARQLDHRIRRLQGRMRSLPDDTGYVELEERERHLLSQIKDLSQKIGMLRVNERRAEHELAAARRSEELAKRDLRLQSELNHKLRAERRIIKALEEFINRMARERIGEVERHLTRMFLQLNRKDDVAEQFVIDPESYTPSLIKDAQTLDLDRLSEGEKELFALAFLWAIGRSSPQELPIVIDTPLARLDSVHRKHIAKHFLPHANRQTIVLSTDTEIDSELWASLKPFVAKAYRLEYDPDFETTAIHRGYFFGEETRCQ